MSADDEIYLADTIHDHDSASARVRDGDTAEIVHVTRRG